jgi:hypothetical protein
VVDQSRLAASVQADAQAVEPTASTSGPVVPVPVVDTTPVVAPPTQSAVSPYHDEPFLVCTRAHESNGDYSVVSGSGYYGAYQFLPTTWNATAAHAGRLDLVGVLPSVAAPADQDDLAWALYLWQGNSPWGGRC